MHVFKQKQQSLSLFLFYYFIILLCTCVHENLDSFNSMYILFPFQSISFLNSVTKQHQFLLKSLYAAFGCKDCDCHGLTKDAIFVWVCKQSIMQIYCVFFLYHWKCSILFKNVNVIHIFNYALVDEAQNHYEKNDWKQFFVNRF